MTLRDAAIGRGQVISRTPSIASTWPTVDDAMPHVTMRRADVCNKENQAPTAPPLDVCEVT
jgi:hypothetical protein